MDYHYCYRTGFLFLNKLDSNSIYEIICIALILYTTWERCRFIWCNNWKKICVPFFFNSANLKSCPMSIYYAFWLFLLTIFYVNTFLYPLHSLRTSFANTHSMAYFYRCFNGTIFSTDLCVHMWCSALCLTDWGRSKTFTRYYHFLVKKIMSPFCYVSLIFVCVLRIINTDWTYSVEYICDLNFNWWNKFEILSDAALMLICKCVVTVLLSHSYCIWHGSHMRNGGDWKQSHLALSTRGVHVSFGFYAFFKLRQMLSERTHGKSTRTLVA